MPPIPGERCENCLRHYTLIHRSKPTCDECLPKGMKLSRCGGCKLTLYCGKACQKAHRQIHRSICMGNQEIEIAKMAMLEIGYISPELSERHRTFGKWCDRNSVYMSNAAVSAIGTMYHPEKLETYVFLVYIDVITFLDPEDPAQKRLKFARSLRKASAEHVDEIHRRFDDFFAYGRESVERSLGTNPKHLRMVVVDDGLPEPLQLYTLPTELGGDLEGYKYTEEWHKALRKNLPLW